MHNLRASLGVTGAEDILFHRELPLGSTASLTGRQEKDEAIQSDQGQRSLELSAPLVGHSNTPATP